MWFVYEFFQIVANLKTFFQYIIEENLQIGGPMQTCIVQGSTVI